LGIGIQASGIDERTSIGFDDRYKLRLSLFSPQNEAFSMKNTEIYFVLAIFCWFLPVLSLLVLALLAS